MKKRLKALLIAFVIIPCILVLHGCSRQPNHPQIIENFRITSLGIGRVQLAWDNYNWSYSWSVHSFELSSNNGQSWVQAQTTSSHEFSGLSNSQHTFRIRAVHPEHGIFLLPQYITIGPPDAIGRMHVSRLTFAHDPLPIQYTILWNIPSSDGGIPIIGYEIQIRKNSLWLETQFVNYLNSSTNQAYFHLWGRTYNSYIVTIRAFNAFGYSFGVTSPLLHPTM